LQNGYQMNKAKSDSCAVNHLTWSDGDIIVENEEMCFEVFVVANMDMPLATKTRKSKFAINALTEGNLLQKKNQLSNELVCSRVDSFNHI